MQLEAVIPVLTSTKVSSLKINKLPKIHQKIEVLRHRTSLLCRETVPKMDSQHRSGTLKQKALGLEIGGKTLLLVSVTFWMLMLIPWESQERKNNYFQTPTSGTLFLDPTLT